MRCGATMQRQCGVPVGQGVVVVGGVGVVAVALQELQGLAAALLLLLPPPLQVAAVSQCNPRLPFSACVMRCWARCAGACRAAVAV